MCSVQKAINQFMLQHPGYETYNVGLSGGRDSVVLLTELVNWFRAHNRDVSTINAVHINHGISNLAEQWTSFCEKLCQTLGVSFSAHHVHVDMASKDGVEAAARDARYAVFKNAPAGIFLVAQHKNDQAETFLFNIFRGCSISSAGGMPRTRLLRDDLVLYRPFLDVARKDIDAYVEMHKLEWVEDDSNTDTSYSRNFIRHDILPTLSTHFSSIENRLVSTAERFEEAGNLLDDLAEVDLGSNRAVFPLPVELFASLPERRARNLLRYVLNAHGLASPAPAQMNQAIHQFVTAKPDRKPEIKIGSMRLVRVKKMICLEPA